MNIYFDSAWWCVVMKVSVLKTSQRMRGQKRPARPRLASLSPGKAFSLDSLPHDTPFVGAVAGEKFCQLAGMQGQHSKQQQGRKKATTVTAVERISRVPKRQNNRVWKVDSMGGARVRGWCVVA
eukprot:1144365-Pelagomonas_calceolata.AAC.3